MTRPQTYFTRDGRLRLVSTRGSRGPELHVHDEGDLKRALALLQGRAAGEDGGALQ
jgi:hypothetical protein